MSSFQIINYIFLSLVEPRVPVCFVGDRRSEGTMWSDDVPKQVADLSSYRAKKVRMVRSHQPGLEEDGQTLASRDYKLHVVLGKESYAKLVWLKAQLEASTEAEVIRRALKAYERFEPHDDSQSATNPCIEPTKGDTVHVYIRITEKMKCRLDDEYAKSGRSYGEQVRQALRVLMQLVRDTSVLQNDEPNTMDDYRIQNLRYVF